MLQYASIPVARAAVQSSLAQLGREFLCTFASHVDGSKLLAWQAIATKVLDSRWLKWIGKLNRTESASSSVCLCVRASRTHRKHKCILTSEAFRWMFLCIQRGYCVQKLGLARCAHSSTLQTMTNQHSSAGRNKYIQILQYTMLERSIQTSNNSCGGVRCLFNVQALQGSKAKFRKLWRFNMFAMLHMLTLLCITSKILFHGTTRLPRQHLPRRLRLASAKRRWGSFSKLPTPAGVAKFPLSVPTAAPTQPAPGPAATLARPAPEQPQSCGLGRAKCNNKSEIWRLGTESLDRLCQTQCTLARAARCLGRLQLHQALFVLILTSRWLKRTLYLVYHVSFIVPFLSMPTANHIRIYAHCLWFSSSMAGICSNHIAIIATLLGS